MKPITAAYGVSKHVSVLLLMHRVHEGAICRALQRGYTANIMDVYVNDASAHDCSRPRYEPPCPELIDN